MLVSKEAIKLASKRAGLYTLNLQFYEEGIFTLATKINCCSVHNFSDFMLDYDNAGWYQFVFQTELDLIMAKLVL